MAQDSWSPFYDKFIGPLNRFEKKSEVDESNRIEFAQSDIGRNVGFNRVAIHHVVLPPRCRTTLPHAESHEEEFFYVIEGKPHLWLNGFVKQLEPGTAVGFPSGTGDAHTVINNTEEDVYLLVAGERTKKENLCVYPLQPEYKSKSSMWWDSAPIKKLGPHRGGPGPINSEELLLEETGSILNCKSQVRRKPFHYPGDNETFGEGFRVSNHVGLKALGIWYEYLPSGKRSAFPHAHTHEEEFVFVVRGELTVWIDGFSKTIRQNEFVAFPSNTGHVHTVINNTSKDVIYICIGESQEFADEKILYPLNELRKKECIRKGWYWEQPPVWVTGDTPSKSNFEQLEHLSLKICTEFDWQEVLNVFSESPRYFLNVEGCIPSEMTARHSIIDVPTHRNEAYFKEFLMIELNGVSIGTVDLHVHHPEHKVCYLGLLLIKESLYRQGMGTKCYKLVEDYILRSLECEKVRLGISEDNDVEKFWSKLGFDPNGRTYNWQGEQKVTSVKEFEKEIKK